MEAVDENRDPQPQEERLYFFSFVYPPPEEDPRFSHVYLVSAQFNNHGEPPVDIKYHARRQYNRGKFDGVQNVDNVRGYLIDSIKILSGAAMVGQPIISYILTADGVEVNFKYQGYETTFITPNVVLHERLVERGSPQWLLDIIPMPVKRRRPIDDLSPSLFNKKPRKPETGGQGGGLFKSKKRKSKKRKSKKRKSKKRKSKKGKSRKIKR